MRVAVVGAGISGLAAALELAGSVDVVVLEGSSRCGGKIATLELDGIRLDGGAESVLARRPEAVDLIATVGLAGDLVHPTNAQPAVLLEGRARSLPPSVQGVPSDVDALAGLLTPAGFARACAEPELPAPPLATDVPIGVFVEERFGTEVTDRLLEPMLGGVYAGRSRELSFEAVSSALFEKARRGGSLSGHAAEMRRGGSGPVFAGVAGGVGRLVDALITRLSSAGVEVRTSAPVRELRRDNGGFRLVAGPATQPEPIAVDAVVLACPAHPAGRLLGDLVASAPAYAAIPYASLAVVTVVIRGVDLQGSGLLVPPGELPTIKAVTHSSRKWAWVAEAAGRDTDVVRLSVGRRREEALLQVGDQTLLDRTIGEARGLPGWSGAEVVAEAVSRWGGGLPQYLVGHRELISRLRRDLDGVPGLAVSGAATDGVGIAACIASGQAAAGKVLSDLG
jgi:protoporphyrinogen/coproporphyrinogen III oxidase